MLGLGRRTQIGTWYVLVLNCHPAVLTFSRIDFPGSTKVQLANKQCPAWWKVSLSHLYHDGLDPLISGGSEFDWVRHRYVISKSRDVCLENTWIFFRTKVCISIYLHNSIYLSDFIVKGSACNITAGRIFRILSPASSCHKTKDTVVIVEQFQISDTKDVRLNMPMLIRAQEGVMVLHPDV